MIDVLIAATIPQGWTSIGMKGGASILERIWYPWFESDFQEFMMEVDREIDDVTVNYQPPAPELRFIYTHVLGTRRHAAALKPRAQEQFRKIIEMAVAGNWTEEALMTMINATWEAFRGYHWTQLQRELEQPRFMSTRHYTWFFRPYVISIFVHMTFLAALVDIIIPAGRFSLVSLLLRVARLNPWLGKKLKGYAEFRLRMGAKWKKLRHWWFGIRPLLQHLMVKLGHGAKLRITPQPGLLGLAVTAANVGLAIGWALGYLLFDVIDVGGLFAQKPTTTDWAEARKILNEAGLYDAVHAYADQVRAIKDELKEVERMIHDRTPVVDVPRILDALETRIGQLRLPEGDAFLSSVNTVLQHQIDQLRALHARERHIGGSVFTAAQPPEETELPWSEAELNQMIKQKAVPMEVFQIIIPQLENIADMRQAEIQAAGADTTAQQELAKSLFAHAVALSEGELKAYGHMLAQRVYADLEMPATIAEETHPTAKGYEQLLGIIEDLEGLLSDQSVDLSAYQALIAQLTTIVPLLPDEEKGTADHVLQVLTQITEAIAGAAK